VLLLRKLYSATNLYSDDVIDDVKMICENRNFYLRLFVKGGSLQLSQGAPWLPRFMSPSTCALLSSPPFLSYYFEIRPPGSRPNNHWFCSVRASISMEIWVIQASKVAKCSLFDDLLVSVGGLFLLGFAALMQTIMDSMRNDWKSFPQTAPNC